MLKKCQHYLSGPSYMWGAYGKFGLVSTRIHVAIYWMHVSSDMNIMHPQETYIAAWTVQWGTKPAFTAVTHFNHLEWKLRCPWQRAPLSPLLRPLFRDCYSESAIGSVLRPSLHAQWRMQDWCKGGSTLLLRAKFWKTTPIFDLFRECNLIPYQVNRSVFDRNFC